MPKQLSDWTKELEDQQLYQNLLQYLQSRNAVPQMRQGNSNIESGSFDYGDGLPPEGALTVHPQANRGTIPHELTHAAERQMLEQYYRGKPNGQYADAFEKLYLNGNRKELANRLNPQWTRENAGYRSANYELGPWAVGNTISGNTTEDAPQHLDSTLATETEILLDLARRKKQKSNLEQMMNYLGL